MSFGGSLDLDGQSSFFASELRRGKGMSKKKKLKAALREAIERSFGNMDTIKLTPVNDRKDTKGQ